MTVLYVTVFSVSFTYSNSWTCSLDSLDLLSPVFSAVGKLMRLCVSDNMTKRAVKYLMGDQ